MVVFDDAKAPYKITQKWQEFRRVPGWENLPEEEQMILVQSPGAKSVCTELKDMVIAYKFDLEPGQHKFYAYDEVEEDGWQGGSSWEVVHNNKIIAAGSPAESYEKKHKKTETKFEVRSNLVFKCEVFDSCPAAPRVGASMLEVLRDPCLSELQIKPACLKPSSLDALYLRTVDFTELAAALASSRPKCRTVRFRVEHWFVPETGIYSFRLARPEGSGDTTSVQWSAAFGVELACRAGERGASPATAGALEEATALIEFSSSSGASDFSASKTLTAGVYMMQLLLVVTGGSSSSPFSSPFSLEMQRPGATDWIEIDLSKIERHGEVKFIPQQDLQAIALSYDCTLNSTHSDYRPPDDTEQVQNLFLIGRIIGCFLG
jgi:hypothetical protein